MRTPRHVIRTKARDLLRQRGVTEPPVPVEEVARGLGIEIARVDAEDELSGFLLRDVSRGRTVIGVNPGHSQTRQRFTIAHELGHFLLHQGEALHVDGVNSYRVERRDSVSSRGDSPTEIEANQFAAEILMPEDLLRQDLVQSDKPIDLSEDAEIERLATRYQVSTTAMTFRLANLRFIRL